MDIRGLLILCGGLFVVGCDNKSVLPMPPTGPNESTTPVIVPYPPPAARAEIIPPKPGARVVWIDGTWLWDRRRWIWQKGRWEAPPTGAYYAQSKVVQQADGTLAWYPAGWQTRNGQTAQRPAPTE